LPALAFGQSAQFNLSQLAHNLAAGGLVKLDTSVTAILPCPNGGTGTSVAPTNGEILIGNGTCWTPANITGGSNITVTNGPGTITIASTGGGSTPGGSPLQIQYNNSGVLGGIAFGTAGQPLLSNGSGSAPSFGQLDLTIGVTNSLPIANGGTGATTAASAMTNLLPTYISSDCLSNNGTALQWISCGGSGTAFQANGVSLSSSATVNFQNSNVNNGLTLTFSNPSAGNVQLGLTGWPTLVSNDCLTNNGTVLSWGLCGIVGAVQVNGVGITSPTTLNFQSSASTNGLTVTESNPSAGNVQLGVSGLPALVANECLGANAGGTALTYLTCAGGSGTVSAGTASQLGYYASNGNVISGLSLGNGFSISSGTLFNNEAVNSQTGTTYTVVLSDCSKQITFNNAAAVAVTLPGANGSFAGCQTDFTNLGAGTATITPVSGTINGATSLGIAQNRQCTANSDGTNWQVIGCTALDSSSLSGSGAQFQTTIWSSTTGLTAVGPGTSGQCYMSNGAAANPSFQACPSGGSPAFNTITSGTNTTATMAVGTGATFKVLGSSTGGTIFASAEAGATDHTVTFPSNTGTVAELNIAQTFTLAQSFGAGFANNKNGAASSSAGTWFGTPFTSGTGTTAFPLDYFSTSGATVPTTLNANGGYIGINSGSTFTGDALEAYINGAFSFDLNIFGNLITSPNAATSATSVTPNCNYSFVKVTASATGTFTVNAPGTCTPKDGQKLELKVISPSGGTITYAWNATYLASATLALPTTSNAASKEDYFQFQYDADKSGWVFLADNQGF